MILAMTGYERGAFLGLIIALVICGVVGGFILNIAKLMGGGNWTEFILYTVLSLSFSLFIAVPLMHHFAENAIMNKGLSIMEGHGHPDIQLIIQDIKSNKDRYDVRNNTAQNGFIFHCPKYKFIAKTIDGEIDIEEIVVYTNGNIKINLIDLLDISNVRIARNFGR